MLKNKKKIYKDGLIHMKYSVYTIAIFLSLLAMSCKTVGKIPQVEQQKDAVESELQDKLDKEEQKLQKKIDKEVKTVEKEADAKAADLAARAIENSTKTENKSQPADKELAIQPPDVKDLQPKTKKTFWQQEGWNVQPEILASASIPASIPANSSKEWYYKRVLSQATPRSIELKSPSYIEFTCKNTARKERSKKLLDSLYGSLVKNPADLETNQKIRDLVLQSDGDVQIADCRPVEGSADFAKCECMLYLPFKGGEQAIRQKIATLK